MHPTPQCPSCGSIHVIRADIVSGVRGWECQECAHIWEAEPSSVEPDLPPS